MSGPRNNLADVLKHKGNTGVSPPTTYTPPPRTKSGPKFKPALSTTSNLSIGIPTTAPKKVSTGPNNHAANASNGLPSFSTPGFRQAKSPSTQKNASETLGNAEPVIISDQSSCASSTLLKRSSSDPDVVSEPSPQAYKRPKNVPSIRNKENTSLTNTQTRPKENTSKFLPYLVTKAAVPLPGLIPPKDQESRPQWMEAHLDLLDISLEGLENFLNKHHELLTHVMQLLLDGMSSSALVDAKVLQNIRTHLEERIKAIKWTLAQKRGKAQPSAAFLPESFSPDQATGPSNALSPVIPSSALAGPSSLQTLQSILSPSSSTHSPKSNTLTTPTTVTNLDNYFSLEHNCHSEDSDGDEELWQSFGDMPVEAFETVARVTPVHSPNMMSLPCSKVTIGEIRRQLTTVFSLTEFRSNQLEAITATLAGRDVFVLMPTGGGKSLCYQLPAVCATGRTCGVTIVVSPLTALMEDQVSTLTAKGVDAFLWNAESVQQEVASKLFSGDKKPSLLYVTPEKLRASGACRNLLNRLYRQQQLARFAIDEAHCISTWGQDFRSAYQGLGQLRKDYPDVPIIALTATANQRTREDIVNQLQLRDHAFFTQSFNRPNLKYVIKNKKSPLNDIVDFIKKDHNNHSGVIYCLSRNACETLSAQLGERGIAAEFFHAGLTKEAKTRLLESWKADKFRVIVATIAFGMGIDKPDVRFVIHYDLPKSLSGYYQETGRAGRDGKPADCVLYYGFRDFRKICWMIENNNDREEPLTPEAIERQKDAAREVVKYCSNISECRKVQMLRHFGQEFDQQECNGSCDNCLDDRLLSSEDVTIVANNAVDIVKEVLEKAGTITLAQLTHLLRGTNGTKIRERGLEDVIGWATCKSLSKELVELALDRLLVLDVLTTTTHKQHTGYSNEYVELGSAATAFREKRERLQVDWRPPPPKATKSTKQNQERHAKGKRRGTDFTGDDPIESFPDDDHAPELAGTSGQSSLCPAERNDFPNSMSQLYNKLDALRQQIKIKDGLKSKDMVMGEALLQSICYACPSDYLELSDVANNAAGECTSSFEKHRGEILQLCIQHKLETSGKLDIVEIRNRFAYNSSSSNGIL